MTHPRILVLAVASFAAAACSRKDAPSDSGGDVATASSAAVASPASAALPDNPTSNEIAAYKLDMDKVRKLKATMTNLEAAARADPTTQSHGDNSETAAQTIARLESNPKVRRAIEQAGWTVRDYVWTTAALLQASMLEATIASTPGARMPDGQDPQNVEFVKAHKAEIEQLAR